MPGIVIKNQATTDHIQRFHDLAKMCQVPNMLSSDLSAYNSTSLPVHILVFSDGHTT